MILPSLARPDERIAYLAAGVGGVMLWVLTIMVLQAVAMLLMSGGSFGLVPLGLLLFGILALPCMAAASLMAAVRRRLEGR